jgi:hypothetical protein
MNNCKLTTADRLTHIKVVVVSLMAAIAVVLIGIAARPNLPDLGTRMESRAQVFHPDKQVNWINPGHAKVQ